MPPGPTGGRAMASALMMWWRLTMGQSLQAFFASPAGHRSPIATSVAVSKKSPSDNSLNSSTQDDWRTANGDFDPAHSTDCEDGPHASLRRQASHAADRNLDFDTASSRLRLTLRESAINEEEPLVDPEQTPRSKPRASANGTRAAAPTASPEDNVWKELQELKSRLSRLELSPGTARDLSPGHHAPHDDTASRGRPDQLDFSLLYAAQDKLRTTGNLDRDTTGALSAVVDEATALRSLVRSSQEARHADNLCRALTDLCLQLGNYEVRDRPGTHSPAPRLLVTAGSELSADSGGSRLGARRSLSLRSSALTSTVRHAQTDAGSNGHARSYSRASRYSGVTQHTEDDDEEEMRSSVSMYGERSSRAPPTRSLTRARLQRLSPSHDTGLRGGDGLRDMLASRRGRLEALDDTRSEVVGMHGSRLARPPSRAASLIDRRPLTRADLYARYGSESHDGGGRHPQSGRGEIRLDQSGYSRRSPEPQDEMRPASTRRPGKPTRRSLPTSKSLSSMLDTHADHDVDTQPRPWPRHR